MPWYTAIVTFFSTLFSGLFGHLYRGGGTRVTEDDEGNSSSSSKKDKKKKKGGSSDSEDEEGSSSSSDSSSGSDSDSDDDSDSSSSDDDDDDSDSSDSEDENNKSITPNTAAAATTSSSSSPSSVATAANRRGRSNAFYGGERPTVQADGRIFIMPCTKVNAYTRTYIHIYIYIHLFIVHTLTLQMPEETSSFIVNAGDINEEEEEEEEEKSKDTKPEAEEKKEESTAKATAAAAGATVVRASRRFIVGVAETVGRRPTMEDAHYIGGHFGGRAEQDFYAVFDGHNGRAAAAYACRALPQALGRLLAEGTAPAEALRQAFAATHDAIAAAGTRGGTTVSGVLFAGDTAYVAHVGDSRVALVRGGTITSFTKDHRPTDPDEHALVLARGGLIFRGRVSGMLAITRALGDLTLGDSISHEPDVVVIPFPETPAEEESADKDTGILIIACDGLWDYVE